MKQINLKLTEKQLEDLEKLSNAMGNVSKSNLIRIAITEYIMKHNDYCNRFKHLFIYYNSIFIIRVCLIENRG
jgi:metal-responsive CopG/Arc/MetJ family transcriptional regulator